MSAQVNDKEPIHEAANDSELEGLPQKEREETKQILGEIAAENAPKPVEKTETAQKPEKVEDKTTTDDGKSAKDLTPKEEAKRREKVVPAWMLKISEKKQKSKDEQIAELSSQLEKLKEGKSTSNDTIEKETVVTDKQEGSIDEMAKEYAEQEGISIRLAKDIILAKQLAEKSTAKFGEVDNFTSAVREQQQRDADAREEQLFNQDFEKDIIPLIRKEYGDDVPKSTIEQIKADIKSKAYTEEFAKVPYSMIYKGDDSFRSLVPPAKKPVEGQRTVALSEKKIDSQDTGKDLTKVLTEDELKGLTDAEFDTYSKNMERRQGSIR